MPEALLETEMNAIERSIIQAECHRHEVVAIPTRQARALYHAATNPPEPDRSEIEEARKEGYDDGKRDWKRAVNRALEEVADLIRSARERTDEEGVTFLDQISAAVTAACED